MGLSRTSRLLPAVILAAGVGNTAVLQAQESHGPAETPATQQAATHDPALQAQIAKLQAQLDELKAREAAREAQERTAANQSTATATASAVQADADKRPSLDAAIGYTAGYIPNKGFFIASEDGNFVFHPWAYMQFRYVANYRQHAFPNGDSSTDTGFEMARLKLVFDGNMFGPDLTYQFIWNTVKSGGNLQLNDAWVRYHFHDTPFAIQVGQIRDPLDHEQIMFATQTTTVDRSLVDDIFAAGEGIVQGVDLQYAYGSDGPPLRAEVAFTHGLRNNNTSFQDFPTTNANWGVAGRVDYKIMGDWPAYERFSALDCKHTLLVVGAGADYTEAGDTGGFVHVVDAQYNLPGGLSLYGAYLGRYTSNNAGPPGTNGGSILPGGHPDTYDATARVMVGYLIQQHFEPYARYEYIHFDPDGLPAGATNAVCQDFTIGANYYFHGQRAKFSANVIYLPEGFPVSDNTVNDILATPNGGSEVVFQAQFQLII